MSEPVPRNPATRYWSSVRRAETVTVDNQAENVLSKEDNRDPLTQLAEALAKLQSAIEQQKLNPAEIKALSAQITAVAEAPNERIIDDADGLQEDDSLNVVEVGKNGSSLSSTEPNTPDEVIPDPIRPTTEVEIKPENAREKLIRELADSIKWVVLFDKFVDLADARNTADFENLAYVRSPSSKPGSVEPFVKDIYGAQIRTALQRVKIDDLHYFGPNQPVRPPPGEVTIRYLGSENEAGKKGITFIISLVNGRHSFDNRWNECADYVAFDLEENRAKSFFEEAAKDPSFIKQFFLELFKQRPSVMESFTEPAYVVFATQPGPAALRLNKETVRSDERKIGQKNYLGEYVISDGKSISRYNSGVALELETPLPEEQVVESLGVRLPERADLRLSQSEVDQKYLEYHSISESLTTRLQNTTNLREIYTIANGRNTAFLNELAIKLNGIQKGIDDLLKSKQASPEKLNALLSILPEEFGIREKVRPGFLVLIEAFTVLASNENDPAKILQAVRNIAETVAQVYVRISFSETSNYLKFVNELPGLLDQPEKLIPKLDGDNLGYELAGSPYFIGAKIFLSAYEGWNFVKKWRAKSVIEKSPKGEFLLKNIKSVDPNFKFRIFS